MTRPVCWIKSAIVGLIPYITMADLRLKIYKESRVIQDRIKDDVELPPRFGCSSCLLNDRVYVWRGSTSVRNQYDAVVKEENTLYSLDVATLQWTAHITKGKIPEAKAGMGMCVIDQIIYVFGGWVTFGRCNDVHCLTLDTMTWSEVKPVNPNDAPLRKDKFGMVEYEGKLCIFGGAAESDPMRRDRLGVVFVNYNSYGFGWTNELHVFDPKTRYWSVPDTTGEAPKPCAAASFTKVDRHTAVLFGGRQKQGRVNDLAILNMEKWEWSGVLLPLLPTTPWPGPRSFHSAVSLRDPNVPSCMSPKLLVLWGLSSGDPVGDNDRELSGEVLSDGWILDVKQLSWTKVESLKSDGRLWHSSVPNYLSLCESQVITVGGSAVDLYRFGSDEKLSHTVTMEFGIKSLFKICALFINKNKNSFEDYLCLLPVKVLAYVNDCIRYDEAKKLL